ncbi:ABC transporter permease [Kribbella speibonae]|uniref:ABC transporter permease n=2 Tax=Kribbella speibonae TaxID=1572660 RepID=A0A4R0IYD5_9ACTN|nr:ABC transporter permease [Kribbella speibonae]
MVLVRLAAGVAVMAAVLVVVFLATQALPSDPAEAMLGRDATPDRVAALRVELGLDEPAWQQFRDWTWNLVRGNPGDSISSGRPVLEELAPRLRNSLVLLLCAAGIAIPLSFLLGIVTAARQRGHLDRALLTLALGLSAVPEFVIGVGLLLLLSTGPVQVLPAVSMIPADSTPLAHLDKLLLPVLTLTIATVPYLYRMMRASMIEALASDYVQTARLKGLPPGLVLRRHALRNALVPSIQASALVMSYLLSGAVVTEFLFRYPGLGTALSDAVSNRDLPMIQTITVIFAAGVVLMNLIADVLTVTLTPRLRGAGR